MPKLIKKLKQNLTNIYNSMFGQKRPFSEISNEPDTLSSPDKVARLAQDDSKYSDSDEYSDQPTPEELLFDELQSLVQDKEYSKAIEVIKSNPQDLVKKVIHLGDSWLCMIAASDDNVDFINSLIEINGNDKEELYNMVNKNTIYVAADANSTNAIKCLIGLLRDDQQKVDELIHQYNSFPFNKAAEHGNVELMQYYLNLIDNQDIRNNLIYNAKGYVLIDTACSGNIKAVKFIIDYTRKAQKPIHDDVLCGTVLNATSKGYLEIIKYLLSVSPEETHQRMLHHSEDISFVLAAKYGRTEIVKYFLELTPDPTERSKMVHAQNNAAFIHAIKNGYLEIAELLVDLTPDPVERYEMIHAQNDAAFVGAAGNQQIPSLNFLFELVTDKQEQDKMFHAGDDGAFRILTARDMERVYHKPQHNQYAQTIATDYPNECEKLSAEIIDIFFKHDFAYFKNLFYQIKDNYFTGLEVEKRIFDKIAEYDARYPHQDEAKECLGGDSAIVSTMHDAS